MEPYQTSSLKGKTLLWIGTSIPEGRDLSEKDPAKRKNYPAIVAELCGATVINAALGSSAARASSRTNDRTLINTRPFLRSLSQTLEEKEETIRNWRKINPTTLKPEIFPDGLSEEEAEKRVRGASFERKILPYLDGTYPMPDLFVYDHGYNDVNFGGPALRGDIDLVPDAAKIRAGLIAPDEYMVKNDYENLRRFFGDLSGIPKARFEKFIASVNRYTFIGASNFLFTLILHHNPYARIVVLGTSYPDRAELIAAQRYLAESWGFSFINPALGLGWGNHLIPGTARHWKEDGVEDQVQKSIFAPDGTHPHLDTKGRAISLYARVLAEQMRNLIV